MAALPYLPAEILELILTLAVWAPRGRVVKYRRDDGMGDDVVHHNLTGELLCREQAAELRRLTTVASVCRMWRAHMLPALGRAYGLTISALPDLYRLQPMPAASFKRRLGIEGIYEEQGQMSLHNTHVPPPHLGDFQTVKVAYGTVDLYMWLRAFGGPAPNPDAAWAPPRLETVYTVLDLAPHHEDGLVSKHACRLVTLALRRSQALCPRHNGPAGGLRSGRGRAHFLTQQEASRFPVAALLDGFFFPALFSFELGLVRGALDTAELRELLATLGRVAPKLEMLTLDVRESACGEFGSAVPASVERLELYIHFGGAWLGTPFGDPVQVLHTSVRALHLSSVFGHVAILGTPRAVFIEPAELLGDHAGAYSARWTIATEAPLDLLCVDERRVTGAEDAIALPSVRCGRGDGSKVARVIIYAFPRAPEDDQLDALLAMAEVVLYRYGDEQQIVHIHGRTTRAVLKKTTEIRDYLRGLGMPPEHLQEFFLN